MSVSDGSDGSNGSDVSERGCSVLAHPALQRSEIITLNFVDHSLREGIAHVPEPHEETLPMTAEETPRMATRPSPTTVPRAAKPDTAAGVPAAQLTLFRSVAIIIGVIVGSGIFESPPRVANAVTAWWGLAPWVWVMIAWALGGLFSFIGALVYAELATNYPQEGGDYVYLNRAFGDWAGFLFGWARLSVIQAASIGAIAYVVGDYATRLHPLYTVTIKGQLAAGPYSASIYAAAATVVLTIINILGVREGTLTQNLLTIFKVLGLAAVVVVAFLAPSTAAAPAPAAASAGGSMMFGLALVFILWTYGGWNEIAYVSAEVKDPRRNILRSLLYGLAAVVVIYMVVNAAFLYSLGYEGLKNSTAVAADVMAVPFGETGARLIAALVVISALGALNGFIFTSPRVYYAMGKEHRVLAPLGYWSPRFGTPVVALLVQAVIILILIGVFGTREGFDAMVKLTAAVVWGFFALTGLSLFVLRTWDRQHPGSYRVMGHPLVPLLFVLLSLYMLHSGLNYAPFETAVALAIFFVGLPIYWISKRQAVAP